MQPKVTILMPCYNASTYLETAINSILNQSYENFELLLIDDGSIDNTLEIINAFAQSDRRIKAVKNEKNLGLILTLNKGVELATGEYIARMDADDISERNRIELLVSNLEKEPDIALVSSTNYYINPEGKLTHSYQAKGLNPTPIKFMSFFSTPVVHASIVARTEVLQQNPYDLDYIHSEDYELFSRMLFKGYKFKNIDEPLYYIRLHKKSVSSVHEQIQIDTHLKISLRNIMNYFRISPDITIHKIMVNRFNFSPTSRQISSSFELIEELKTKFLSREDCSIEDIYEINKFIQEQKIDVIIQSLKYKKHNISIILFAVQNIKLFSNRIGWKYLKVKFNSKFNG